MSTEELLKPRYKVIADYPGKPHTMPVGHVLTLDKFSSGKWWHQYTDVEPIHIDEGCTKFAAVLKQLDWWEERKLEDMPEYLKALKVNAPYPSHKEGEVIKVMQWFGDGTEENTPYFVVDKIDELGYYPSNFIPATKEEYDNQ